MDICSKLFRISTVVLSIPELIPNLIDELPILFIASLFAKGESKFFGIEELKHKESDRLAAMQEGFEKLGIKTEYNNDVF